MIHYSNFPMGRKSGRKTHRAAVLRMARTKVAPGDLSSSSTQSVNSGKKAGKTGLSHKTYLKILLVCAILYGVHAFLARPGGPLTAIVLTYTLTGVGTALWVVEGLFRTEFRRRRAKIVASVLLALAAGAGAWKEAIMLRMQTTAGAPLGKVSLPKIEAEILAASSEQATEALAYIRAAELDFSKRDYFSAAMNYRKSISLVPTTGGYMNLGISQAYLSEPEASEASFQAGLSLAERKHDNQLTAYFLTNLGRAYHEEGRLNDQLSVVEKALTLHTQVGDKIGEGNDLNQIGDVEYHRGQFVQAETTQKRALSLFSQAGYQIGLSDVYNDLSMVQMALDRPEEAVSSENNSIEIATRLNDWRGRIRGLRGLAAIDVVSGRVNVALERYTEALRIAQGKDDPWQEVQLLVGLGSIYAEKTNDSSSALSYFRRALTRADELDPNDSAEQKSVNSNWVNAPANFAPPILKVAILVSIADIAREQKRFADAQQYYKRALDISRHKGNLEAQALMLERLAATALGLQNATEAIALGQQSAEIFDSLNRVEDTADSLNIEAIGDELDGHTSEAITLLERVASLYERVHKQEKEETVQQEIARLRSDASAGRTGRPLALREGTSQTEASVEQTAVVDVVRRPLPLNQPSRLKEAVEGRRQVLKRAINDKVAIDPSIIKTAGDELIAAGDRNPLVSEDAWSLLMEILNYRSFLRAQYPPDGLRNFQRMISKLKKVREFKSSAAGWPGGPDIAFVGQGMATPGDEAVLSRVGDKDWAATTPVSKRPAYLYLFNGEGFAINGFKFRHAVVDQSHVVYDGSAPTILEDVYFVNCTFTLVRNPRTQRFAISLLEPVVNLAPE